MSNNSLKYLNRHFLDTDTGLVEKVIDVTKNSFLLTQTKTNENGINCSQWFTDAQFEKQFKTYEQQTTKECGI